MSEEINAEEHSLLLKPYYVYVLADPLNDNEIFYVGKGKSKRGFDHLRDALNVDVGDTPKISRIRSIYENNSEPLVRVIARFDTEDEAYSVESVLIHWVYGYNSLTNEQSGHGSKYVRSKSDGLVDVLAAIDIPRKIKILGQVKTGYLQDKIDNHVRLHHAEMMQDLYEFLQNKNVKLHPDGVVGLESGRYLAITIEINQFLNLVLQITDSDRHSIIPNFRSVSDKKQDRDSFNKYVSTVLGVDARNGGRYAKLKSWKQFKVSVEEHDEIYRIVIDALDKCH